MASVVPRTKTISRGSRAFRNRCTVDARPLVGRRGALAEQVHAAVDVGVVLRVEARDRVDDRLRLLRGRRVVEIDERLAVHLLLQDREVARARSPRRTAVARPTSRLVRRRTPGRRSHTACSIAGAPGSRAASSRSTPRAAGRGRCGRDVVRERADRACLRAASRPMPRARRIEQRVLVELADGRAVRALHVVGEDLELRLRVDLRVVGRAAAPCWSASRRSSARRAGR